MQCDYGWQPLKRLCFMGIALTIAILLGSTAHTLAFQPVVSSGYGWRTDPMNGSQRFHAGIDLPVAGGTPVVAPLAGKVVLSGWYHGYGNTVVLQHPLFNRQTSKHAAVEFVYTLYGHNQQLLVGKGQWVKAGQAIAQAGSTGRSTGPHVHFEVRYRHHYVDPRLFLSSLAQYWPTAATRQGMGSINAREALSPVVRTDMPYINPQLSLGLKTLGSGPMRIEPKRVVKQRMAYGTNRQIHQTYRHRRAWTIEVYQGSHRKRLAFARG